MRRFLTLIMGVLLCAPPAFAASDKPLVIIAGRTQVIPSTDSLLLPAPSTDGSAILTPGSTPASPTNGAIWTTTAGLFARISGASVGPYGVGSVTATGSPVSGNLAKFSGAAAVTNADLTGDVTTSGTVATIIAANVVTNAKAAQAGANTMKGNWGASTANVADNAMPSCSGTTSALKYTSGAGIGCQTFGSVVTQSTGTSGTVVPLLNAANFWDATQTDRSGTNAVHYWESTSAATDAKFWRWIDYSNGCMQLEAVNDALSASNAAIAVCRSAAVPTTTSFQNAPIILPQLTVSTLPACNGATKGALAEVTDALVPTFHGALTGGSTTYSGAMCNGASWIAF